MRVCMHTFSHAHRYVQMLTHVETERETSEHTHTHRHMNTQTQNMVSIIHFKQAKKHHENYICIW